MSHPLTMHSSSLAHIPIIINACPCTSAFGLTLPSIPAPTHTLSPMTHAFLTLTHGLSIPNPCVPTLAHMFPPWPMCPAPFPPFLAPFHTFRLPPVCPSPPAVIRLDWPMDGLVLGKVYQSEVSPAEHVHSHPHDYLCLHMTTIQTKWTARCVGLHGIYGEFSWLCHFHSMSIPARGHMHSSTPGPSGLTTVACTLSLTYLGVCPSLRLKHSPILTTSNIKQNYAGTSMVFSWTT